MTEPAPAEPPLPLSNAALSRLPAGVTGPRYDRSRLRAGILHIGMGNFHRAHQAAYLDDLFALGRDHDWAIAGAGLMAFDAARRAALRDQDWLYALAELAPGHRRARVIGALVEFCPVEAQAIVARIADPAIRIISLTITEGGYFIDAATGKFDAGHPAIRADAADPAHPRTVFGVVVAGLALRRARGLALPTILSCDNVQGNGAVTRNAVVGTAALIDPALAEAIAAQAAFPNCMVDRITPATTEAEIALVAREFGVADAAPVICEPFRQWVLEDRFPLGRPALEEVGARFVDDVSPYETMKLRILNAGHAAIAYPAALLGHARVDQAMADPDIAAWLDALMRREVIPVLPPIPGEDYGAYLATCAARFANPEVGDTVARLCQDGSDRQPKFVLPTIAEARAQGRPVNGLALEVALWCRYVARAAEEGSLDDPRAGRLGAAARATASDPAAFLALDEVFGPLGHDPAFASAFARHVGRLWQEPVRAVLQGYLAAGAQPS